MISTVVPAEASKVEAALLGCEDVAEAVVVPGQARSVAYVVPASNVVPASSVVPADGVVPASGVPSAAGAFRRHLRTKLPSHLVPTALVVLDALPRTDQGDIDLAALPPAPPGPRTQDGPRDQWELAVADLWGHVLGLDEVGVHDDFTQLGGDPAAAQTLLAMVADQMSVRLPATALVEAPNVEAFTRLIIKARAAATLNHPTLIPMNRAGARTPLFCFAGAGGLAFRFLGLVRHFGSERPAYGLQAHGLEQRGRADWSIDAAAVRHIRNLRIVQPHGPYVFLGHSFGGLIAHRAAQILTAEGEETALLVLLDTFLWNSDSIKFAVSLRSPKPSEPSGECTDRGPADRGPADNGSVDNGSDDALPPHLVALDRLRQLVQLPVAGIAPVQGNHRFEVFYNQGRAVTLAYRPTPWEGRALVYAADEKDAASWRTLIPGAGCKIRPMIGNHDTMLREPNVTRLADEIRVELDKFGI